MRSILRKFALGLVVVGGILVVQPGDIAIGAQGTPSPRAAVRKCVNVAQKAREAAQAEFRKDIRAARALPPGEQRAALEAAQEKYRNAGAAARTAFQVCLDAIDLAS